MIYVDSKAWFLWLPIMNYLSAIIIYVNDGYEFLINDGYG